MDSVHNNKLLKGFTMSTPQSLDLELAQKAAGGNCKAFSQLVQKYEKKLQRAIARVVKNPELAEDLTQETFIKVYKAIGNFRGESQFYTWIYRIGINVAKTHLGSLKADELASATCAPEDAEHFDDAEQMQDANTPEGLYAAKEIAERLNKTLEALPQELREALTLREIEGLSYEEIAQIAQIPVGTVRSRIFRAREAVSASLKTVYDCAPDRRW